MSDLCRQQRLNQGIAHVCKSINKSMRTNSENAITSFYLKAKVSVSDNFDLPPVYFSKFHGPTHGIRLILLCY